MIYRLVCLTHGESPTLDYTLESFFEKVDPPPESVVIACDGPGEITLPDWFTSGAAGNFWGKQLGFCGAVKELWHIATEGKRNHLYQMHDPSFVFWLEHDFIFEKRVDLRPMAVALSINTRLSQMQLMRASVNPDEHKAGGVMQQHISRGSEFLKRWTYGAPWLEHNAYFTTNPSLMSVSFMRQNPWPAYNRECEGKFGIDLKSRGYTFGVWGEGETWVRHIGERTGFGY